MGIFGTPRDRFARRVLTTLRHAGVTEARYDSAEFRIDFNRSSLYLNNVFQETREASRTERDERIARFVRTFLDAPPVPAGWLDVRPMLRPVLRPATFTLGAPNGAKVPLRRPAFPYLNEMVVIDTPDAMRYVTTSTLADWGVTETQVFDAARTNLAALSAVAPPSGEPAALRLIDDGNAYFVSRLLVDGWLARLAPHVGGRPVAFAPDVNTLMVVRDEPEELARVLAVVEDEYRRAPRSVSPCAYTVDDRGAAVPYPVTPDHPAGAAAGRAAAILAGDEYAAQASWLAREHERDGTDVFVARLMVVGRPDGTTFTAATWSRDVDTLLPQADVVGIYEGEDQLFYARWATLEREVDLEPEPGLDPVRYRLRSWPPDGVVQRLRAAAVAP